jgi:probable phosphoglycerate mutase
MSSSLREEIAARRRIYLVRHGEVSYFDEHGKPYPPDGVPLNEEGVEQARALRKALAGISFDRAVCTGLPRTCQTAEIVVRGRGLAVETCEELRELTSGKLREIGWEAGADGEEAAAERRQRLFVGALRDEVTRESRFLGGETFGAFADRVLPAFARLLAAPDWKHLLLVAHGGTNRLILLHALGAELAAMGRLEQDAGCLNLIDVAADGALLVRLANYTPYEPLKHGMHETTMEKIFLEYQARFEARFQGGKDL